MDALTAPVTNVLIRYDLRAPAFAHARHAEMYATCLEQCAWADAHGLSTVILSEHHGVDDGYLPATVTLAAAIAGRTTRIHISLAALLVPLHDPIRLAEQLAVLDLLSGSRVSLVAGLGYRREEFAMAGLDFTRRGQLFEEYIGVMRTAWTGEPFEWRGRTIRVTPRPAAPPAIVVGGYTAAAARRAARLRLGLHIGMQNPTLADTYRAECARRGFTGGFVVGGSSTAFVHVSEDPERDWARIAPYALYDGQTYASWANPASVAPAQALTIADIRQSGSYLVITPDECVALARSGGLIVFHPLLCGLPAALGWASLELFAAKVLPRISG